MKINMSYSKKSIFSMLIMSILVGVSLHKDNEIYAESIDVHSHIVNEDRLSANHAQLHLAAARQKNKALEQETTTVGIQGTVSIQATTKELPEVKEATSMTTSTKEQTAKAGNATQITETTTTSPDRQSMTSETTQNSSTQHSDMQQTTEVAQVASRSTVAKSIPDSGMYIDGVSSQIGTYSTDGGQVPTYTPYAYWWNTPEMASHNYYLVDNSNSNGLGQKVLDLRTGDPVYLNGTCYHVTSSVTVYPGQYASQSIDFSHHLYIQTCYGANASDGMRAVSLD